MLPLSSTNPVTDLQGGTYPRVLGLHFTKSTACLLVNDFELKFTIGGEVQGLDHTRVHIFLLLLQVWFQNRRMKDKRQKMTLSWPCGDPVLAAYVLQAAAASGQLPYPGIFAAAAAAR